MRREKFALAAMLAAGLALALAEPALAGDNMGGMSNPGTGYQGTSKPKNHSAIKIAPLNANQRGKHINGAKGNKTDSDEALRGWLRMIGVRGIRPGG